uniref:Uncharacterized protein n=1 Tax=viral metagenome TaxID=1070528 RepID=A0A6M3LMT1_9ZZZZ
MSIYSEMVEPYLGLLTEEEPLVVDYPCERLLSAKNAWYSALIKNGLGGLFSIRMRPREGQLVIEPLALKRKPASSDAEPLVKREVRRTLIRFVEGGTNINELMKTIDLGDVPRKLVEEVARELGWRGESENAGDKNTIDTSNNK